MTVLASLALRRLRTRLPLGVRRENGHSRLVVVLVAPGAELRGLMQLGLGHAVGRRLRVGQRSALHVVEDDLEGLIVVVEIDGDDGMTEIAGDPLAADGVLQLQISREGGDRRVASETDLLGPVTRLPVSPHEGCLEDRIRKSRAVHRAPPHRVDLFVALAAESARIEGTRL